MVKKHEVLDLIANGLEEAINPEQIIIVDTCKCNNELIVTFTEKDMTESCYRVSVEMVDKKDKNEKSM